MAKQTAPGGHEIGQWTFFPNFAETKKYTGVLAAKNFDLVRDDLAAKHMLDLVPRFVDATGRHAVLLYKEEIEVLLRTHGHAGFALLDLHDYPGQGTALIGLLDPFWDSKGFVTPNSTGATAAPLCRCCAWTSARSQAMRPSAPRPRWRTSAHGPGGRAAALEHPQPARATIASGSLAARKVPTGQVTDLGRFTASLVKAAAPGKLTVAVALAGTPYVNEWEIWVYPAAPVPVAPAGLTVSREWTTPPRPRWRRARRWCCSRAR